MRTETSCVLNRAKTAFWKMFWRRARISTAMRPSATWATPLHCAIFRRSEGNGGFFTFHDQDGLLFTAVTESNLAYALAQSLFGGMVSEARYGADIFENMDDPDGC